MNVFLDYQTLSSSLSWTSCCAVDAVDTSLQSGMHPNSKEQWGCIFMYLTNKISQLLWTGIQGYDIIHCFNNFNFSSASRQAACWTTITTTTPPPPPRPPPPRGNQREYEDQYEPKSFELHQSAINSSSAALSIININVCSATGYCCLLLLL